MRYSLYTCLRPTASLPRGKIFLKRYFKNRIVWTVISFLSKVSKYNRTKVSKGPNASRMGQGYIQSNPPHVVSYLDFICDFPRSHHFVVYTILLTSNQKPGVPHWLYDVKFRSQCIWRQSCNGILIWRHIIMVVRGIQTGIFSFSWSQKCSLRKIKAVTGKSEIYVF